MIANPLLAGAQHMHSMAGEVADKRVGYLLTGLAVTLGAIMVIKDLKGAFRDEYAEWEKHHERHLGRGR